MIVIRTIKQSAVGLKNENTDSTFNKNKIHVYLLKIYIIYRSDLMILYSNTKL